MEDTKILIANENTKESQLISQKLTEDKRNRVIKIASSGKETLECIQNQNFDVLILDLVLSDVDGFEIIEKVKGVSSSTKIIVVTALSSDTFVKKAMNMGAEYYMLKPINLDSLVKRVNDLFIKETENLPLISKFDSEKSVEEKITNIFITVGIPAHIKGYQFLREAIKLAMEDPDIINSITKKLYPSIAERFDTSASKVERAIRHAIEVAWNRGKIENINNIFGLTVYSNNEKPTNGEFIALVADKMLLEV